MLVEYQMNTKKKWRSVGSSIEVMQYERVKPGSVHVGPIFLFS